MKERILKIIEDSHLTSSEFAIKIGVQNAQISHIKTGRNNVSLDIVMKILDRFPEISPDWLLFGKGEQRRIAHQKTENQSIKPQKEPIQLEMPGLFDIEPTNASQISQGNEVKTPFSASSNQTSNAREELVNGSDENHTDHLPITQESKTESSTLKIEVSEPSPTDNAVCEQKKEKSDTTPPHTVKKIIVFYSDKAYEEFTPAD